MGKRYSVVKLVDVGVIKANHLRCNREKYNLLYNKLFELFLDYTISSSNISLKMWRCLFLSTKFTIRP